MSEDQPIEITPIGSSTYSNMTSNIQVEGNPAFARIPPWVKAKLRPIAIEKIQQVHDWIENECIPAERIYKAQLKDASGTTQALDTELRKKAKAQGLFNLFLPNHFEESPGLTNLEYSCCAEIMGRVYWGAQVSYLRSASSVQWKANG